MGSPKFLHTLFDKYLEHMLDAGEIFQQNRMVINKHNFDLFSKKLLTIYEKVLTQFWMTFL